jgi:hypothetical protein
MAPDEKTSRNVLVAQLRLARIQGLQGSIARKCELLVSFADMIVRDGKELKRESEALRREIRSLENDERRRPAA